MVGQSGGHICKATTIVTLRSLPEQLVDA